MMTAIAIAFITVCLIVSLIAWSVSRY